MNLYRVTLKGMQSGMGSLYAHGIAYVVTADAESAYKMVRSSIDERKLGFAHERALKSIELLAETANYPGCGYQLYLPPDEDESP